MHAGLPRWGPLPQTRHGRVGLGKKFDFGHILLVEKERMGW
jgi:hypothetical protein